MRSSLVAALVSCVDRPLKTRARRFLLGLSTDELQFIAGFLGCCVLESGGEHTSNSPAQLARRIAERQQARAPRCSRDQEHKLILLLEYLGRSSATQATAQSRRRPAVPA